VKSLCCNRKLFKWLFLKASSQTFIQKPTKEKLGSPFLKYVMLLFFKFWSHLTTVTNMQHCFMTIQTFTFEYISEALNHGWYLPRAHKYYHAKHLSVYGEFELE